MKIYREVFSPIEENTFVITGDDTSCIIIDCGCYGKREEKRLEDLLDFLKLEPVLLLNTHCHLDHVFGNGFMFSRYGLSARCHPGEAYNLSSAPEHARMFGLNMDTPPEPGLCLCDGEIIEAAGLSLEVIAVPGHSPGGVAFLIRNEGVLFTGDALFAGSIGRSDLPGGHHKTLIKSITERLFTLPEETVVYPGHGPETTIGHELNTNSFFK
ncbi:MAG TPA: MBL fold metallo-hydrolase [Bacteroidales bacterium]|nr:MBL fold metallo-hydrolase [Bacteroidales bacterium]